MTENTMMSAAWGVTFDGEAHGAFVTAVQAIPSGYTVAILAPGLDLPEESGIVSGVDVSFVSADDEGVRFRYVNTETSEAEGPEHVKPWSGIGRVHVY